MVDGTPLTLGTRRDYCLSLGPWRGFWSHGGADKDWGWDWWSKKKKQALLDQDRVQWANHQCGSPFCCLLAKFAFAVILPMLLLLLLLRHRHTPLPSLLSAGAVARRDSRCKDAAQQIPEPHTSTLFHKMGLVVADSNNIFTIILESYAHQSLRHRCRSTLPILQLTRFGIPIRMFTFYWAFYSDFGSHCYLVIS